MIRVIVCSLLFCGLAGLAHAHHPPVVVPPPVVTPPPPVVIPPPTVAPPPAPAAPAPAQPPPQSSGGTHGGVAGWFVMGFVATFFYLAICQLEEERNPELHKRLLCPKTPKWE